MLTIILVMGLKYGAAAAGLLSKRAVFGGKGSGHSSDANIRSSSANSSTGSQKPSGSADAASNQLLSWRQYIERGQRLDDLTMYSRLGTPQSE